jgi:hypothetical protein
MSPSSPESAISLELVDAGVVLQQVPHHQHLARPPLGVHDALGVRHRLGQRLLDEAVLAGVEDAHGLLGVARDGGGEHDGVQLGVGEQILEAIGEPGPAELALEALASVGTAVAAPAQLGVGQRIEVAREVGTPVAQAHDPHAERRAVTGAPSAASRRRG